MKSINGIFAMSFLLMALAMTNAEDVLDTNGDTVMSYNKYYILPYNFALGGGLSLADTANKTCRVDVIKEISEVKNGMPLRITPVPRITFVPIHTSVHIQFDYKPKCAESSEWILVKDDEKWFVGIGGPENHPGRETMKGLFHIEKYGEGYKLVFCPTSTDADADCGNIVTDFDENHNMRLSLDNEDAYEVVFRKANRQSFLENN